ncbi:MAG: radical SAM protein [Planctomycetota bacterium]
MGRLGYLGGWYIRSLAGIRHPLLAGIKLTHACNLACAHCPFWRRPGPTLGFDRLLQVMDELHGRGVRLVIFEGGEPLLWRDGTHAIHDAIAAARARFFRVGVTTNGTLPLSGDPDIVWVSIDGLQPTHDRIRGPGTFDRAMRTISGTVHPALYGHITINRLNQAEIGDLVVRLAPLVKGITIQFHYPYGGGEEDLCLDLRERRPVLDRLMELKRRGYPVADSYACLRALRDNSWTCRPWMIASVEPDGTVREGCYARDRGPVVCGQCGFAAHAEISLAWKTDPGALRCGFDIFRLQGRALS